MPARREIKPPLRPMQFQSENPTPLQETESGPVLERAPLGRPHPARRRLRRLFNPVTGWFRRLEREASFFLGNRVYPHLPGLTGPYGFQLRRSLTVTAGELTLPRLPPDLDGLTLLLITDIHTGPFLSAASLGLAFQRLMELDPHLILLGGDLVTGHVREFDRAADAFRSLHAPLGVHAVLGNHDHYTGDACGLKRRMESAGIHVLHNQSVLLSRGEGSFHLAGIDDLNWGEPDLEAALAGTVHEGREAATPPVILLSHNPDIFFEACRRDVDLVLAGHTHGGQIRIPGWGVLVRMSRFHLDEGLFQMGNSRMVVSRGLGATGVPLRFSCPPEAVLVTLRSPAPR
ncbi:MAG: metallophosphoesterase [Acidobacteriota bacterium]